MRITLHKISVRLSGFVAPIIRTPQSPKLDEVRHFIVLGVSYEDAVARVRERIMPALLATYEPLVSEWSHEGERGDVVELSKVGGTVDE